MPYQHLGDALATDYLFVREEFDDEQWQHFLATRRFVDKEGLRRSTATGRRPSCRGRSCAAWPTWACSVRKQFGKPICSFQLVQDPLVRMLAEVTGMQLYCMQLARLETRGRLTDSIAGLAKLNNTRSQRLRLKEMGEKRSGVPSRGHRANPWSRSISGRRRAMRTSIHAS